MSDPGSRGWSGAVLCGGGSRRMGTDKALVEVDGAPMLRRVARALLDAGATEVVAVGADDAGLRAEALAGLDVVVVADDHPGEGPLGGILTALRHTVHDIVLVVACDLLAPSPAALRATVAALGPDADVAAPEGEWLHAAWYRPVEDDLRGRFAAGDRAVHRAVAAAGLAVAPVPGVDPAALADADRPDDLHTG